MRLLHREELSLQHRCVSMVLVEIIPGPVKVGGLLSVAENIDIEAGCSFPVKFVFCGAVLCKF